eukprot:tig00001265_g7905.t1
MSNDRSAAVAPAETDGSLPHAAGRGATTVQFLGQDTFAHVLDRFPQLCKSSSVLPQPVLSYKLGEEEDEILAVSSVRGREPSLAELLPGEIILRFFFFLDNPADVLSAALTCKTWYAISSENAIFWRLFWAAPHRRPRDPILRELELEHTFALAGGPQGFWKRVFVADSRAEAEARRCLRMYAEGRSAAELLAVDGGAAGLRQFVPGPPAEAHLERAADLLHSVEYHKALFKMCSQTEFQRYRDFYHRMCERVVFLPQCEAHHWHGMHPQHGNERLVPVVRCCVSVLNLDGSRTDFEGRSQLARTLPAGAPADSCVSIIQSVQHDQAGNALACDAWRFFLRSDRKPSPPPSFLASLRHLGLREADAVPFLNFLCLCSRVVCTLACQCRGYKPLTADVKLSQAADDLRVQATALAKCSFDGCMPGSPGPRPPPAPMPSPPRGGRPGGGGAAGRRGGGEEGEGATKCRLRSLDVLVNERERLARTLVFSHFKRTGSHKGVLEGQSGSREVMFRCARPGRPGGAGAGRGRRGAGQRGPGGGPSQDGSDRTFFSFFFSAMQINTSEAEPNPVYYVECHLKAARKKSFWSKTKLCRIHRSTPAVLTTLREALRCTAVPESSFFDLLVTIVGASGYLNRVEWSEQERVMGFDVRSFLLEVV